MMTEIICLVSDRAVVFVTVLHQHSHWMHCRM